MATPRKPPSAVSRRAFLAAAAGAPLALPGAGRALGRVPVGRGQGGTEASPPGAAGGVLRPPSTLDPWLEVDPAALRRNAAEVSRLAGGRPVLAVVKNDAYGLGLRTVGPVLDRVPEIAGLAVVKTAEAIALREAGVRKPVLLMGRTEGMEAEELARRDVLFAPYADDDGARLTRVAARLDREVGIHLYLDTGMGRLGMPFRRALRWMEGLASRDGLEIAGTFTALTEEDDFDPVQLERFRSLAAEARGRGLDLGRLHAASSHALFHRDLRDAGFDMVRPGLVLYGAYPAGARGMDRAVLRPALRLRARVVRVARLEPGDGVSYGRRYVAERPTWIATLPVGHADGYPRTAVEGCEVVIGGRAYPVIGAVSASHTIVELGAERTVEPGATATLVGPDHDAVHPNEVAERAGVSVYDVLMHLSARLPRVVSPDR